MQLSALISEMCVKCGTADDTRRADEHFVPFGAVGCDRLAGKTDETHEEIHHEGRDGMQCALLLYAPEIPPLCERFALFFLLR